MAAAMAPEPLSSAWLARLRQAPAAERPALVAAAPAPWQPALAALLAGPEPDDALVRAEGLPAPLLHAPWPARFCRLLHEGSYAPRLCALDPAALAQLSPAVVPVPALEALRAAVGREPLDDVLGRVRTGEYLRLCAREVEGAPLEEVGHDLSTLAAACLQVLLEQLQLDDQVVVFGMGKLGGDELNFLSDIDLVLVHDDAVGERRGGVADLHERLRKLVRHLEGQGRWRPLFRVDLRLRPFGSRGPLSTSVCATEAYYERHGRPWERQVWLRARPLAGRLDLGALVLRRLTPFVYRRAVGPEIFAEIADMMRRARREATRVGEAEGVDLKLDAGGIREIEFAVQALQLLHGGRNPGVRSPGTLPALDGLLAAGLVSDREHRELSRAYRWLRRVEHRLQLAEGQQTHRVPAAGPGRERLVRRLQHPLPAPALGGAPAQLATPEEFGRTPRAFDEALAEHRARARAIAQTIAGDEPPDDPRARDVAVVLDEGAPRGDRQAALQRLHVHDGSEAEALLEHLYTRPDGPFAALGAARRGAENLLRACLDSADPTAAIGRLVELAAARPAHYGLWRAFAEPSPAGLDMLRLTGELLGASEPLSRGLIGFSPGRPSGPPPSGPPQSPGGAAAARPTTRPDRTLGLLERAAAPTLPDPAALAADLRRLEPDPRGLDATLLHFKHEELVRVGLHDLGRRPDPLAVGRALSDVADLVLRMLLRDLAAEAGASVPVDLAVLALGKYGMQAMDYGSDLDLMFVFDPVRPHAIHEALPVATRAAQRLMSRLESRALGLRLYEVDMRLRPSGRQGLLVTSLAGFGQYHARRVAVWERLALLRLRPVAEVRVGEPGLAAPALGDRSAAGEGPPPAAGHHMAAALPGPLGAAVRHCVAHTLGWDRADAPDQPSPAEVIADTRRLKGRIDHELARETPKSGWYDAKTGAGGCLELELLVAALQLVHGPRHPQARGLGIVEALEGLRDAGCLPADEAAALASDYRFQRLLLNRLRMSPGRRGDDPDRFNEGSPRLDTLARRMGLQSRAALLDRFHRSRARVRAAFDRHLPA
jgi:[glutamine synthetase] adenylyltransferase / [glutamine synthetase]-adenylyl-L-tyrosine phosphorylase